MSLSQIELSRRVYNSLDLLSDIGGLFSTFSTLFAVIVAMFQYRGSYLRLMKDMGEAKENYKNSMTLRNKSIESSNKRWCLQVLCINLKMRCP